ncbi:hypothetical protein [uncultured Microbulbifer sp.]|uniref:hypothetical protein n=1 Tax=uncultured Microbulbifer sp. TaxID=348147 RepID=UPI0026081260|nr:hypothetical protein [uncultured Microbulbifer sp.]
MATAWGQIAGLYTVNHLLNLYIAPKIGQLLVRFGERRILTLEYVGLIQVFAGYALVESAMLAATLYIIDHLFFSMTIAIKTYFQKIVDERDIAASAGVSFTINHIAAVVIPVLFGLLWLSSPSVVFFAGALMALVYRGLAQLVPGEPGPGNEARVRHRVPVA